MSVAVRDTTAVSQPIPSSGPNQAKTDHPADKASNSQPLASAAKVPLLQPQAEGAKQSANTAQPPSHTASVSDLGLAHHWWHKFNEDPIVAFTVVLAISTILLWWETRGLRLAAKRQSEDTKEALRIAKQAADATADSVEVARKEFAANHRPTIRIRHVWPEGELRDHGWLSAKAEIVNIGIAEAVLLEYGFRIYKTKKDRGLEASPVYEGKTPFDATAGLKSGDSTSLLSLNKLTLDGERDNKFIREGSYEIYCFGYVRYRDDANVNRTTAFCRKLEKPVGPVNPEKVGRFVRLKEESESEGYEYQE